MADGSKIEWTDATWNVVIGCDKVSPGCDHCYAIKTARRMQANPTEKIAAAYAGTEAGGEWTGQVNLVESRLELPLHWTRPRRIFVNAQSDLFHDSVPDEFIAKVWAVMGAARQHTFQILTKRPGRMRSLLTRDDQHYWMGLVAQAVKDLGRPTLVKWPLPHVWLGVSVEDQKRADLRIPQLLDTPAAVRFLSCEPLLGPVDLRGRVAFPRDDAPKLHWVIAGGESGPGARPMHPDWARSLRDQCVAAGVAFHFKQWGEWAPAGYSNGTHLLQVDGHVIPRKSGTTKDPYGYGSGIQDLVDRGHPGWVRIRRPGKRLAGRVLDDRTWDEFPEAIA